MALANHLRLSFLKAAHACHVRCSVQEIRAAHLLQPMYAKVREHGAPVQGARLAEEARDLSHERTLLTSFLFQISTACSTPPLVR